MVFFVILPTVFFLWLVNWFVAQENPFFKDWFPSFLMGSQLLVILTGVVILFNQQPFLDGKSLIFIGGLGFLLSWLKVRKLLSHLFPLDPESAIHSIALLGSLYLCGMTFLTLSNQSLVELANEVEAVSIWEVIANGLLWASIALFGVGLFSRRSRKELIERLGLRAPTIQDVGIAIAWVIPMLLLQVAIGLLSLLSNPEQLAEIGALNEALLADLNSVPEWFLLALSAAVGEELLFRGALQPIFGIWLSSAVFALIHLQYGFSPIMILIFALGFILGMIRRRYGTTVAIMVHFGYNFFLGMMAIAGS